MLVDHAPHIDYRWQQYTATKEAIEAAEGSLLEFAQVCRHMVAPALQWDYHTSIHKCVLLTTHTSPPTINIGV